MEQATANDAYSMLENNSSKIWMGLAIGTAIGLGIALSRRKKSRWDVARKQLSGRSAEFAGAANDIVDRVKTIYAEGAQIVEDACELWTRGRKMVGY